MYKQILKSKRRFFDEKKKQNLLYEIIIRINKQATLNVF